MPKSRPPLHLGCFRVVGAPTAASRTDKLDEQPSIAAIFRLTDRAVEATGSVLLRHGDARSCSMRHISGVTMKLLVCTAVLVGSPLSTLAFGTFVRTRASRRVRSNARPRARERPRWFAPASQGSGFIKCVRIGAGVSMCHPVLAGSSERATVPRHATAPTFRGIASASLEVMS
jgi:hypothetical protein